jgi:excisionase family DNA binding protein
MTAATATAPGGELLTLDELAARLKLHPVTVRGLKRRGVIPALKIGHRTLRFEYAKVLDALRQAGDQSADQANG